MNASPHIPPPPPSNPPPPPRHHDNERLFAEKARKFDDADASFRSLVESLTAYKAAILNAAECGVTVAVNLDKFFALQDRPHKHVASKFLEAQQSIRSKWLGESEKHFDADVLAPIKSRLEEIPTVRTYMKHRSNALVEMTKRQKKLQAERRREGARFRDKQRKCKDMSDQYTMFNDEVIKRFNYIERNMGTFVTAPLRSLVSIMSDMSKAAVDSLAQVVSMVEETPPITKDLSPMPIQDVTGGVVGLENWDESFEDNNSNNNNNININNGNSGGSANGSNNGDANLNLTFINTATTLIVDDDRIINGDISRFEPTDLLGNGPHGTLLAPSELNTHIHRSRTRVRSAEAGPGSSSIGMDSSPFADISLIASPRRGRSASSAPADSLSTITGSGVPLLSSSNSTSPSKGVGPSVNIPTGISQTPPQFPHHPHHHHNTHRHHPTIMPGSSSGHASQLTDPSALAVTSVASSSASTDNMILSDVRTGSASGITPMNNVMGMQRIRRQREHDRQRKNNSIDAVGSMSITTTANNGNDEDNDEINTISPSSQTDGDHSTNGGDNCSNTTSTGRRRRDQKTRVVAIYNFSPRESNELSLQVGNVVQVLFCNDSGWWKGQCGKSRGYFPQNYTRPLTEKEELEYMAEKERRRKRRGHRRQESSESSKPSNQTPLRAQSSSVPAI